MRYINYIIFYIACFSFLIIKLCTPAMAVNEEIISTTAKQAIIIDYDTGTILYSKNADEKMPTSSMSKVMTMYMVFDALKKGDLSLDDALLVSEKAWRKGGSKMFVPIGEKIKVNDLIRGVIVQSGNDATIVLAEGVAGSEDVFIQASNKKAQELGMNNSNFMNASGWPDPDHYSTAHDLAKLAIATIRDFPEYYPYYSEKEFIYNNIKQMNRNPLISMDIGVDGMKTGHTDDGGYGLIASGVGSNGRRIIMVLNGMKGNKERKDESLRMMKWASNSFKTVTLFGNDNILGEAGVYLGSKDKVALKAAEKVNFIAPKLFTSDFKVTLNYKEPLKAPIKKGQEIGKITVEAPNDQKFEVPLIASEDIKEMGIIFKTIAKARLLTTGVGTFK